MIQFFKNIPLKYKLISCFLLIITLNAVSGYMSINIMKQLGELVNVTYDKALMSGTFAQASKFDFSQYDSEVKSALLSEDLEDFDKHRMKSEKAYETLLEDLNVVQERALSDKSSELINELRTLLIDVDKVKNESIASKNDLLKKPSNMSAMMTLENAWTANKLKNKIYRKLTALYDDAAEVGYNFRLSSEEKNTKNLTQTIWIISACMVIGLTLSLAISFVIISPLLKLQDVCKKVGNGDYSIRSDIFSKDELGTLASSFNFMLNTIQDKNENISSLLSSLPFGLFYFDEKGNISKERSNSTDIIFKNFSQYRDLVEFYAAFNCKTHQIKDILRAAFQGLIPFDSAVFLFTDTISIDDNGDIRTVQLSFKPKYGKKDKLERVIVLAEDITEKNRALAESKELMERVERVSKVSNDIASFKEFLPAARKLYQLNIDLLTNYQVGALSEIKRELHSLKGLLGIYSFATCATDIHELEDFLANDLSNGTAASLLKIKSAAVRFEEQAEDIIKLLALNTDSGLKYFDSNKVKIVQDIANQLKNEILIKAMSNLDKFPINKVLAKYSMHAQSIADKLDDKKVKVIFDSSDEVSYEEVQRLDAVLIHVLNNSIDHGIENARERLELNKSEAGQIKIKCIRNTDDSLEFKISDDGKGINGDYLVSKALTLGLIDEPKALSMTEEDRINLIFASGLSTKEETSEVSGRGVGMDAVKNYLESLGGSIKINTKLGSGTTFSMNVPPLNPGSLLS